MRRIDILALLEGALPDLERRFGVTRLALFGSVARDEAGPGSDIDPIVEFASNARIGYRFFDLEDELTGWLGRPARIAALHQMNPAVREAVERDLIDVNR